MAEYLGLRCSYVDSTETGGSSYVVHAGHAAAAIAEGKCQVALVTLAGKPRTGGAYPGAAGRMANAPESNFERWQGMPGAVGGYALAAQRHMYEFGTTSEQLAEVAVTMRTHATKNPMAQYRDPITVDDVLSSRMIADPLHMLDCCVISDGGGACVVTTEERARDLQRPPIYILGGAHAMTHHMGISQMPEVTVTAAAQSGPLAFRRANITAADVDTLQVYDSFTITVVLSLEDLGFCGKGEGGAFVEGGRLRFDGELPTNTDGGGLSACHPGMRGMFLIVEAVRQLRGESVNQAPDPKIAVAHGTGGMLSTGATLVLGTEAP
jgi:acetyl-CoA acetyltransferase